MNTPTLEQAEAQAEHVPGSWFSAATYDAFLAWGEKAGMTQRRTGLVAAARGSVLELGAGTGLNLPHYPDGLSRLVLAEPSEHMAQRLEARLARLGAEAEIVRAPAELLPFADDSFDTVVSTLVLCTVSDLEASLAEIRRVLRPGGSLLFLEHVRSDNPRLGRWQDRLSGPWRTFADGCNCNRPTLDALRRHFDVSVSGRANWRRMPFVVRPLVEGRAS